ncbi:MAG: DNA methyltransferase [Thermoguttaceae bacterium]
MPAESFERYIKRSREPSTAGVLKLVKEHEREQQQQNGPGPSFGGNILTAPASTLWQRLADNSVDLFLTDPPYSEIGLYGALAELAAKKLKPNRLCLAYCGIGYLPAVLEAMSKHLQYHWIFACEFSGKSSMLYQLRIKNSWQPVVVFSKGKSAAGWITDLLRGDGKDKSVHEHQKTIGDVENYIHRLTVPGDLVVDPYCGSGTVPAACKRLGRKWLATEIQAGTARAARKRVA